MDNMDTCCLEDQKKMDSNKVWQWRIICGKEHSVRLEPFHHSNRIGLDINVASNSQKKMDLQLVTNGVILEVCDFAKTVNKSKGHFITNILENNFDLGLENEQQLTDFTAQILHKVKHLIKKPPKDKKEVFTLFDTSSKPECKTNNGLNMASAEHKTESFMVEMDDTDDSGHGDEYTCSQAASKEYMKTESLLEDMEGAHSDDSDDEDEFKDSGAMSAEELMEDISLPKFPYCEEICLNLDVGSKQSLDPGLLTKGVMLELVHFTKILTASFRLIVLWVLEHNFELDLKSQQGNNLIWFRILHLLKRRDGLIVTGSEISTEFKNEPFSFQTNSFKGTRGSALSNMEVQQNPFQEVTKIRRSGLQSKREKMALLAISERSNKGHRRGKSKDMETNTLFHHTELCTTRTAEGDHCQTGSISEFDLDSYTGNECDKEQQEMETGNYHTCPQGESDLNSDKVTNSGNSGNQDHKSCSLSSDISRASEASCWDVCAPFITSTDISSSLTCVNANAKSMTCQPDERGLSEEQTQTPKKTKNNCHMERKEMAPDNDYSCPLREFDRDKFRDSENIRIPKRSLSSDTLSIPTVNSNLNPWLASQPDERGLGGSEEQTQTLNNAPTECDMEQEELGTENNMWKLRANRVKQILSAKEFGPFGKSKKFGLDFNVGFGPNKNFSVDSLFDSILLDIAKFAIAMNSSQQNFIMEILEYNFDTSLESKYQRNIFTCEIMKRVRQLKDCEDSVKFSKEVFELHGPIPSISMANQSVANVNAELSSISRMEECDVACGFPPHSQAETKEHISQKCVDLYPFCKDISLKLHVNNTRPNKKLDINKLTYGAMSEVTNFAEKLCGTFEQICVDIVKHNLDLDLQCGVSDLARSIVARIPVLLEQRKLSSYVKSQKKIHKSKRYSLTNVKLNCQYNPNSDAASAGSSQAAIIDQEVNSSPDIEHQNEFKLKLWQLRANHIQQILSIPHEEQCPLYSYSRCKKLGIDFNVGSGVKQNLDPKLLTNGIMVELGTFATALLSAQKYFITDILEYNFHLYFDNELYRRAFAEKTLLKMKTKKLLNRHAFLPLLKTQFELPDTRCRPDRNLVRSLYCPKCYQVRNHKNRRDDYDSGHMHHTRPHTMTDAGSADANCSAQKPAKDPSSTFSAIEEMIMDSYPRCKEIGLSLCVDKDQPKDKLDMHLLTRGTIGEVASFAKRMCGTKYLIVNDVIQHNFNIGMQRPDVNHVMQFHRGMKQSNGLLSWLNEVFVIQPLPISQPRIVGKNKPTAVVHGSECMESIKKRKLALQTKVKTYTHQSVVTKSKKKVQSQGPCYPMCTEMGLDLEVLSKSGEKEILDLKQMIKSVCDMDQEEMAPDNYYTCPLGESDLDSDELTDLENSGNEDNLQIPKRSLSSDTSSLPTVNSNLNPWFASQPDERSLAGGEEQRQTLKNAPTEFDMEQEEFGTENNMWKLRANRVKQILSATEFGPFGKSKKGGLEFNVGFGPKQNFSVDSLLDCTLLEIAKFAVAMNSSQQNFIMEILEYNFDISLESEYQRNIFTCEIMKRVRQLKDCEDAVKFSKEVFELHGPIPSISMANQSVASVNAELSSISRMEECYVACGFPHSQAETKEHISQKCVDLYPFCKEMSLKLNVNNTRPNKKLDIIKLTYGAMTEVTNFAEKLCGTFEQICVDIVKHNLDLDSQCGDSDLARSIVARIPAVLEQRKLSSYVQSHKKIRKSRRYSSKIMKLDLQNNPNSDAASFGSSQATIIDKDVNSSPDIKHQDELELKLWQLRANRIQQILSIPHEEHCPLYSYSRCKKVGIDFDVGSGVKQNLDPKLLTNGIMVELGTFATALRSAQKYFITDILEYNFHLYFDNELYRRAFAEKTLTKIRSKKLLNRHAFPRQMKTQFKLPDTRCRPEPSFERSVYCPKCYQVRIHKHRRDESDSGHMHHPRPHTMTDGNCSAQKPAKAQSSTFSAIEEMIMDNYPRCKEIGLSLCVDKDQPKDKLDMHVLTHGTIGEVASFVKRLCGTNYSIFYDVLQHNFNIGMQGPDVNPAMQFHRGITRSKCLLSWLNEVFVIQPLPISQPRIVGQKKPTAVVHGSECMESIKKRKLALQTKVKTDTLQIVVKKSEKKLCSQGYYPICTEMGLDLEVTSKSGEKVKLDLERLTRAVVFEIYKFAIKKPRCYIPHTVYEILDYNFDISSQHHRSWEFSITTASTVNNMVKEYRKYRNDPDTVFKLPFVFDRLASRKIVEKAPKRKCTKYFSEVPGKKMNKGNFVQHASYQSNENGVHFENQDHLQNPKSCSLSADISRESEASCRNVCALFTDISSSLPIVNANTKSLTCQPDKRGLGEREEQTQTPKNAPTEWDMEQEEMGRENNMWQLRANRVKQILLAKEFCLFGHSKTCGLEFNVGFGPKQNFSVDSLLDSILLEISKFAIAMNSSQQNFIMEILEYNFDISLDRNYFTCEIMRRVRQLKDCEDAVKFSKEVFELHGPIPSISIANQSVASVNAELSSISRMEECDVACWFLPHSQAETEEHISQKCVDLYPFCKDINLKLHVNDTRPNKKLDINKLTYGAMTEVTNFAEKLCGTFEQICVDIVKHNLDLDSQCGDSDLARSIVARIPAVLEQRKLSSYLQSNKKIHNSRSSSSLNMKLDCQYNPSSDAASAGSSQAAIIDQDVNGSPDIEHQNELELKLWQLRADHIQQILSIPHEEHCPLYSYSRSKTLGIDFNVGSGVKQDLDHKLLTNGIMVELHTFAIDMLSAQKYFITEILEYNFHLDFNNELYRSAFAEKTLAKIKVKKLLNTHAFPQMKTQFKLPNMRCTPDHNLERTLYCPKCYQVRIHKHRHDESGSAGANCSALKPAMDPSSTFSAIEEMIMDSYPLCKEIGLSLCVDKDQPKDKLDMHVLTHGTIGEVASFAQRLCGTKYSIFYDVLQHNFNIGMQGPDVNHVMQFHRGMKQSNGLLSWLNEVFVIQPLPISQPRIVSKKKPTAVVHGSKWMDSIKKRKLSLQTKVKTDTHPSVVKKSEKEQTSPGRCYPMCTEMGQFVRQARYRSDENCVYFLDGAKINEKTLFVNDDTEFPTDPRTIVQINGSQVGTGCGGLLQGNLQIKEEEYDPRYRNMNPELDMEKQCYPLHDDVKTESSAADAEHLVTGEPTELLGYTFLKSENQNLQCFLAEPQRCDVSTNTDRNITTEWDTEGVKYLVPVEAAGCMGYSMVTKGESNESTLIKEEQDNLPVDSHSSGVHKKEVGI